MNRKKMRWSPYSFTEFYILDAVELKLRDAGSDAIWRPSLAYLKDMLDEVKPKFEQEFADILRDYVWIASIGEARHSGRCIGMYIPEVRNSSRSETYIDGYQFAPSPENREIVRSIFEDWDWGGGYGGKKWGEIVRALDLYYSGVPKGVFIDHCADLQHNGGMAFNKNPEFWDWSPGHSQFMSFMNLKRDTDDLLPNLREVYQYKTVEAYTTTPVKKVLNLAWARFDCLPKNWRFLGGVSPVYKKKLHIKYGDRTFSDIQSRYTCAFCGDSVGSGCERHGGEYSCPDCMTYCDHCAEYHHPNTVEWYDSLGQNVCDQCVHDYTTQCSYCQEQTWDMDIRGDDVCRVCWEQFEECEICHDKYSPEEIELREAHDGDELFICEDCAEDIACAHCGLLYPEKDDALYNRLILKLDGWRAEVKTYEEHICPTCVKKHLNTYQPVLKLEDSKRLVIGDRHTELFEAGMKGTPKEQASPISFWDLAGKLIGQTEMYYVPSFNKFICSH